MNTSKIRPSGIRDKLRSSVLKDLARERASQTKKRKSIREDQLPEGRHNDHESEEDEEELERLEEERRREKAKHSNSLLSILPEPKNSSAFGPTVKLDKLLKMPERASTTLDNDEDRSRSPIERLTEDGMVEIDVGKVVSDMTPGIIKDFTIERSKPDAVFVPKGREKQKNQITYLAQLGKATELERKEQAAQSRVNKAAARSKYGW